MSTVIKVENLSKQYRLGKIGTGTLSHDLNRWWHNVRGKEDPYLKVGQVNDRTQKSGTSDYVWALRDVSFEVQQGEVLGVIGKNGAGKSTLLKILSRTTLPTTGSVKVKGRIASLLEVGTGFHPELTGRENIFLNGAILGMRKAEIKNKFDEIVDFAGVDKYVDTPVKRYSSGMYVRLAFAVAAHLDPEILVVDEVLAVGDAEFQKKAIGKMKEVSSSNGRTVLFVSHNLAAVTSMCRTSILLESGRLIAQDKTPFVIQNYKTRVAKGLDFPNFYHVDFGVLKKAINDEFSITRVEVRKESENHFLYTGDNLIFTVHFFTKTKIISPALIFKIRDNTGKELIRLSNMPISGFSIESIVGNGKIELKLKKLPLVGGDYTVDIGFSRERMQVFFNCEEIIRLKVEPTDYYSSGLALDTSRGIFVLDHEWHFENG